MWTAEFNLESMPEADKVRLSRPVFFHFRRLGQKFPSDSRPVTVRVPVVEHLGVERVSIVNAAPCSIEPFQLRCRYMASTLLDVELWRVGDEHEKPFGRPVLGYCSKANANGFYGDPLSHDVGILAISAFMDEGGLGAMMAEKSNGTIGPLTGIKDHELRAFMDICLNVYEKKVGTPAA